MSRTVFDLVIEDLHSRDQLGAGLYGGPMLADKYSALRWLEEAYAEDLDQLVYKKAAIVQLRSLIEAERNIERPTD